MDSHAFLYLVSPQRGYNNVLGSVALRNKLIDVENAIKLANDDGTVTYDEIRNQLKKVDFSDVEIDVFFGISDVNGDGTIPTDESNDMIDAMDDASSDEEFDEEDFAEQERQEGWNCDECRI